MSLTGCARLFQTVHIVQKTQAPAAVRTANAEELQQGICTRDTALKTLKATVEITASTGGAKEGEVKEYTSLRGYIFVRKPGDLRVLLQKPIIGSVAMDMVSDGKRFTMLINGLTGARAIEGTDKITTPSKNGLENLRPYVFLDSLLVPCVTPDEYVSVTESQRILPPAAKHKPAIEEPDYQLALTRIKTGHMLQLSRLIHVNRVDLLPVEQDIYDPNGRLVTVATYGDYQDAGGVPFPRMIDIRRPQDEYGLKIVITKLEMNGPLENDQFELELPKGVPVQHME